MQAELTGLGFKVVASRPSLEQQKEDKERLNRSSASIDTLKELEDEKRNIRMLKDALSTNKSKEEHLQQELKQVLESSNKERKINYDLTMELNESKDRLQQIRNEISHIHYASDEDESDQNKKDKKSKKEKKGKKEKKKDKFGTVGSNPMQKTAPARTPSSPAIILSDKDHPQKSSPATSRPLSSSSSSVPVTPSLPPPGSSPGAEQPGVRSWSKKVVGTYSDVNVQLEVEKEKRQELEKYKAENEGKIEDMKRLVRMEVDSKIKAEEDCLRAEREIAQLREKLKQLGN